MRLSIAVCDDENAQTEYLTALVNEWAAAGGHTVRVRCFPSAESFAHSSNVVCMTRTLDIRLSIAQLAERLGTDFVCCHRSYLVNLAHIGAIGKDGIVLDGGGTIPVSRRIYNDVNAAFIRYYKNEVGRDTR